jgi:hypothetical protein
VKKVFIKVYKTTGTIDVLLLPHKNTFTYSFINLTKGHICSCVFNSIDEALQDLENRKNNGLILDYKLEKELN